MVLRPENAVDILYPNTRKWPVFILMKERPYLDIVNIISFTTTRAIKVFQCCS